MKPRRLNISDIAEAANVSKATVSRVINHPEKVAEVTRSAVLNAMQKADYKVSWQAQTLSRGHSDLIAVIITEDFTQVNSDPTFARLLQAIHDSLLHTQYLPVILFADGTQQQEKAKRMLNHSVFDGAIHLSPYADSGLLEVLASENIPTVLCSQLPKNPWKKVFSTIFADDVKGGTIAAEFLHAKGAKYPIAITGPRDNPAAVERVAGYQEVYPALNDDRIIFANWDSASGARAMAQFLSQHVHFDAVLCGSDRIALGVNQILMSRQITVPKDVKVIGFDNNPEALVVVPPLTTIAQPLDLEGKKAVELLMSLIAGNPPETMELPMALIERKSV